MTLIDFDCGYILLKRICDLAGFKLLATFDQLNSRLFIATVGDVEVFFLLPFFLSSLTLPHVQLNVVIKKMTRFIFPTGTSLTLMSLSSNSTFSLDYGRERFRSETNSSASIGKSN